MMDVKASDKKKNCGGDDVKWLTSCEKITLHSDLREPVSREDFDYEDDDDVPVVMRLSRISSLGTKSKCDGSVKKRPTTSLPVKRPFDNGNSLHGLIKKSKVSPNDDHGEDEDDIPLSSIVRMPKKSADKAFSSLKKEIDLLEKSFEECKRKKLVEEKRLRSIKRDIVECCKELENKKNEISCVERVNEVLKKMKRKVEDCVSNFVAKEAQHYMMEEVIGERSALVGRINECTLELRKKEKDIDAMKKLVIVQAENLESERKKLLKAISLRKIGCLEMKEFESMKQQFEDQVKELESKEKQSEGRVNELESKEKHFEGRVKELESREKQLEGLMEEFESKKEELESEKKHIKNLVKELESKEMQLEGQEKVFKSKEEKFEGRVKEFESKEKEFECQIKELVSKQKQFDSRMKELDSKEKQCEGRAESIVRKFGGKVNELESTKKRFERQMVDLKSKELQLKRQVKELDGRVKESELEKLHFKSQLKEIEGQMKEFQSKKEEFEGQLKEFKSKEEELESKSKHFESQVEDFKSKEKQFEGRWKELESKERKFRVKAKELELKQMPYEGQVKSSESNLNKFGGQLKEPELLGKQCKALVKYIDLENESVSSYMDDRLSHTIDGTSLELDTSEQTDGIESPYKDISVYLINSSDPSRLVLDIIQNPIPLCEKGDNPAIIYGCHIYMLEQLMRISPNIDSSVREEALKLALDLKASMKENTENSLAVLRFLLFLTIYGLGTSFDEDEVLELFAFVAQHKIAMELFGTLGFANKVSDFVENLIRRKQLVAAVRFSCAYNLSDKKQLIDLLREHVQSAKLICESSCEKIKSIEIKDKARDQEIASLKTVLQCISDYKLESADKQLNKEIQYRILKLKAHKGK